MIISNERAKLIISAWLVGEHLEDANLIVPDELGDYADIAYLIRKGETDLIKLAERTKRDFVEIGNIIPYYSEAMYQSEMEHIKHDKMLIALQDAVDKRMDASEVIDLAEQYKTETVELIKAESNLTERFLSEIDKREKREVVRTGLQSIDNAMYGIRPKELTSVGARPSVGKSAFMLQVAVNVAKQGKKVLYFPLEMSTEQTIERILCRHLHKTDQMALKSGRLDSEQWDEVQLHLQKIHDLEASGNFLIYEGCGRLEQIEALVKSEKPYLIVIDQLQQMKSDLHFDNVRSRFAHMTNNLKSLAMEQDVAVWLACQVNRTANMNANNEPTLENLKESGSIEEDSDNVLLLHRDEDFEEANGVSNGDRYIQVNIAKQREGVVTKQRLLFIPPRFTFYDIAEEQDGFSQMSYNDVEF